MEHKFAYPDAHSAYCSCGYTCQANDADLLQSMIDNHLRPRRTYHIVAIEGRLVPEIYIITLDDDTPMVTADGEPVWYFRREDAQRKIDEWQQRR